MSTLVWKNLNAYVVADNGHRKKAVWAPQSKSQEAYLSCPIYEVLYRGTRGSGKTDPFLMDFAQNVGKGFGADYRGIIFRRTYKELADIVAKANKWFPMIFRGFQYNKTEHRCIWPDGETLQFDYFTNEDDYWRHHGHELPFIGWEELTTWPTPSGYLKMMSCSRSSNPNIPRKYRATTNPYGVGHGWVKRRFRLGKPINGFLGEVIKDSLDIAGQSSPTRVSIRGLLSENKILLKASPDYERILRSSAESEAQLRAWLYDDWNVVAGGMFDDVWQPEYSGIPSIPFNMIPRRWKLDRSYDHGQSKPFSVGWWATSNGEPIHYSGRTIGAVPGDLIRIAEWYGCRRDKPNVGLRMGSAKIAQGILEREDDWGIRGRVKPGPADSSIFDEDADIQTKSVAGGFERAGVVWLKGRKGSGSRVRKWQQLRELMRNSVPNSEGYREKPGIFVTDRCTNFHELIPVAPRDPKNSDDVDTDSEDHILDEVGYKIYKPNYKSGLIDW